MTSTTMIRNNLITLQQYGAARKEGESLYIYLNPDKTLGTRKAEFSFSEIIQDLYKGRTYKQEAIFKHLHHVFSFIEKTPLARDKVMGLIPTHFLENFSEDISQVIQEEFFSEKFPTAVDDKKTSDIFQKGIKHLKRAALLNLHMSFLHFLLYPIENPEEGLAMKKAVVQDKLQEMENLGCFQDPDFLIRITKELATYFPEFFCENLCGFSFQKKSDILQVGMLLKEAKHRETFFTHFQAFITQDELSLEHNRYLASQKTSEDDLVCGGICYGNTLRTMGEKQVTSWNEKSLAQARYIQTNHEIFINNQFYHSKGRQVLKNPELYDTTLEQIAAIYGLEKEELIEKGRRSPFLASCIGRAYIRKIEELKKDTPAQETKTTAIQSTVSKKEVSPSVSPLVLRRLGIRANQCIFSEEPLINLVFLLKGLSEEDKKGMFLLSLSRPLIAHAIFFSFDPPCFSDMNDPQDLITHQPKVREYSTFDEMIEALTKHLAFTYFNSPYETFTLSSYEKVSNQN